MIIDRPTPATRNGLGNVIRGWPRWMLCQAVKKHKLCSSWRVKKAYSVGIVKSAAACCTCFSLVIILHIKYLHPLVSKPFCAAPLPSSLLPWRLICNSVRLRILGNRPYSFLQCYTCAVTQGKKSLFSGNCQVGCCLLHVLQLGHHTPHKISASSGFKAFLCSTLALFIVTMASHLQLCSIEDFGKPSILFSAMLHLCRDAG